MYVTLSPDLQRRVTELVASGRYASPSDLLQDALRLLLEVDGGGRPRLERLDADIRLGLEQAERGDLVSSDQAYAEVTGRIEARRRPIG